MITKNFQDFIGFPPPDDHREPFNRMFLRAERTINKVIETDADHFLDDHYLYQIDDLLNSSSTAMIVKKGEELIYYSPSLETLEIEKDKILRESYEANQIPARITRLSDTLFMKTIPMQFSDQSKGTLYLINDATQVSQEFTRFKNSVIYTLILFLIMMIIINTLITYFLSRQIVNPLVRLKEAALKIKNGNYDFRLQAHSRDEIGDLFQSFEAAREQLKKSEKTKKKYEHNRNELITNISHDLKTPITTIKGYVEGIMDGVPKSKEKQQKYLQTIHQNAIHMESLIEDLFLLSNFDLDQSLYQFENINIKDYLSDSYEELQFYLREKGIQLTFSAQYNEQELVKADRQQLKRVILNIINNAVNFKNNIKPSIQMILSENEREAQIEIRDNGKGVPEEVLNKIFDRFYKADKSRSGHTQGTGLGLYIARKIILDHGGHIWARSQDGHGTSIFFTLNKAIANSKNTTEGKK